MLKIKGKKGITLIALIITIIVMLILVGVTVAVAINGGLFGTAKESVIKQEIAQIQEMLMVKQAELQAQNIEKTGIEITQTLIAYGTEIVEVDITDAKIISNTKNEPVGICYKVEPEKLNIKTKRGKGTTSDIFVADAYYNVYYIVEKGGELAGTETGDKTPKPSTYEKIGDTYYNTPDLSNLNIEATYYITYNGDTANIEGRIDRIDTPANWHNYEQKQWANIVTVTNMEVAYWVWIPRYVYKTDNTKQEVDVKFVNMQNECLDKNGNKIDVTGYSLPESFKFGDVDLPGYWISKYEVSNTVPEIIETIQTSSDSITINTNNNTANNTYTIYMDGIEKAKNVSLPYTITGLTKNKTYDVCVAKGSNMLIRKLAIPTQVEVTTQGLNPKNTYYITYDESGNLEVRGRMDKVSPPEDWYNYAEKKWANIITVNESEIAYWVYIPRYEYLAIDSVQQVDTIFIPKSKTTADPGYKIPESFKFGDIDLPGYWISKYEVSSNARELLAINTTDTEIIVNTDKSSQGGTYKVYLDGKLNYTGTLPHTIQNLDTNQKYEIYIIKDNAMIGATEVEVKQKIEIDLSRFDKENTYYVTYDSSGNEILTKLSSGEPENWYNYGEKRWANILTVNGDKKAYWVYIPRYEYKIAGDETVDIKFITKEQTEADFGYKIPESFKFADIDLPGYWISKYEVSQ